MTWRKSGYWLASLLLVAAAARATLPHAVEFALNRKLDRMGNYHGELAELDLQLWRGAYTVRGLHIEKNNGKVPIPLLSAPVVELALDWPRLLRGAVVGKASFESPDINFVDADSDA